MAQEVVAAAHIVNALENLEEKEDFGLEIDVLDDAEAISI